ncbi:MAG: cardiolipin synthase [Clostridia bacterium]|nr:cardiolipin synthase [Clostridia bacterium]
MSRKNPLRRIRNLLNRRFFIALLILAQLTIIVLMLIRSLRLKWLGDLLTLFSIVTALHLLMRNDKSAFKLSLVFLILLFPVFGGAFYWIFHFQTTPVGYRRKLSRIEQESVRAFAVKNDAYEEACRALPPCRKQMHYLKENTPFPVYKNTDTRYFSNGASMLSQMLDDLKQAKRYIFLEYFIIEDGLMWGAILDVLRDRVEAGVDVRIIYDDLGCFMSLPSNYAQTLRSMGIKCELFNRFHPLLTSTQNNRDHRKICVVDGEIAYTGGVNLADEYIGERIKYGKWKDNAVRLCGDGAWSFTVIFLQTWSALTLKTEDYESYRPINHGNLSSDGFVQPYSDSPMDKENVGEHIYLRIIEQAQEYLYITTPYLMADDGMMSALKLCAKSGVDVRIITPEIPDKKAVHFTTRSYYRPLIRAGVKIYEYKDGFMHAKTFVSDDTVATVGTVNLDFRSLYLHFECGTCLYRTSSVMDVKRDYLETLEGCREITEKDCKTNVFISFLQSICRIFAPLM